MMCSVANHGAFQYLGAVRQFVEVSRCRWWCGQLLVCASFSTLLHPVRWTRLA